MFFSNQFNPKGKLALILGGSQGVGAEIALKLYQQQCTVVLVARTESKLKSQVEKISSTVEYESDISASYITCDVSDYDQCESMWQTLDEQNCDPDFIFCCAGSSVPKLFCDLLGKELSQGVDVNYKTALNVAHTNFKHALAQKKARKDFKKRHIVFFSSVVSSFPFIGYGQYAPSKAALTSLSIILRQELGPYNYRVSCVFPGNFQSEGFDEEQKTKPEITKSIEGPSYPIPAAECADVIISALDKGYDTITTDFIGWILLSSTLGVLPRSWGFFQVIVSFVFSIIAPIANYFIYGDIKKFFDKRDKDQSAAE